MSLATLAAQPVAPPSAVEPMPLPVLQEIAALLLEIAASGQIGLTEYGASLLALASDGSPREARLLFKQAIFDAVDEGPPIYEEDLDAVTPLEDASVEDTLKSLGFILPDAPSRKPFGRTTPETLLSPLLLRDLVRTACTPPRTIDAQASLPHAGLLHAGPLHTRPLHTRPLHAARPHMPGVRHSRGTPGRWRPHLLGMRRSRHGVRSGARRAPNVRRGLDVPRRLS